MRAHLVSLVLAVFAVFVLLGGPAAAQVWEVGQYMVSVSRGDDAAIGRSLVTGDVDGDGRDDFVAGAPGPGGSTGAFFLWLGSADRNPPSPFGHVSFFNDSLYGFAVAAGDFDGDGRDEIAVGAPGQDVHVPPRADFGIVEIWEWEMGALELLQSLSQLDTAGSAPEDGDQFGWALAAGDFDNDGFDDLVVGVPLEDFGSTPDTGVVQVFYGSSTGLDTDTDVMFRAGVGGLQGLEAAGDRFGRSLAVGDFDGDAFDDLAIGAPNRDQGSINDVGEVHVIYGSSVGLQSAGNQLFDDTDFASLWAPGERFGWALAAGRLDETKLTCFSGCYDDLVIGVPFHFAGGQQLAGKVLVAYGSASGVTTTGFTELNQPLDPGADTNDFFGYTVAVGHLDPRGPGNLYAHEDLAVSAVREDVDGVVDAGKVHLFFGSSSGVGGGQPPQTLLQHPGLSSAPAAAGDEIGRTLAIGDLDGDGWGDLVIGIPKKDVGFFGNPPNEDVGALQVLYGALFADGFEQGTTEAWSSVVP